MKTTLSSPEDKLLLSRAEDCFMFAADHYTPKFLGFLDLHQQAVLRTLPAMSDVTLHFFGGYPDSERVMAGFFPPYSEPEEGEYPIHPLTLNFRREASVSHRDVLGALMHLSITRESVGDILVEPGRCVIFLKEPAVKLAKNELSKVGREGVKLEDGFSLPLPELHQFEEKEGTVSSMRLDCVVALSLNLSREKAVGLITGGLVNLNFLPCEDKDRTVEAGDQLSLRGYGRYQIDSIGGTTRKGRTFIRIKKFI
ncbi:YlmH family RNA-binding protein [Zongyangia hominis]|uniref:RNA-binding S4 domain-containing protein n=1 Tax=Zongyangia hominis TaxID=2763677 RepID=A0A926EAV7_9FIRM|nr:YlmH/Sll1252 family protein [Zongyangia hominis]MBC8569635.1 hypothetical protein [Zongyangia hominis]